MGIMDNIVRSDSKHFLLHKLSDGIFAAIAQDGGAAVSNTGLIDLGDQVIVFDTFLTPHAARDLRRMAIDLFGRAPQMVINSHYHNDHIWGNQAFLPEAQIISSAGTRQLMATSGREELQSSSANAAKRLAELQSQYQNTQDEQQRKALAMWIGYQAGLVEALPTLSVCFPGITFTDRLAIYDTKLTAELITFEGAHTGSDTVLYLPQAATLFMSDLLFVGCHPYLADGDPYQLLKALRECSRMEANCFVPGHGPVGGPDDLTSLTNYIEYCIETAQKLNNEGGARDESLGKLIIDEQYQHWQLPQFFDSNIRFLCERLRTAGA